MNRHRPGGEVSLVALLMLLLTPIPVAVAQKPEAMAKIEPLVVQELRSSGQADYFVWLTEQADLAAARQIKTKVGKTTYVYRTLVATAERTQRGLRSYLDREGVPHETYYIVNAILVRGGSQALLLDLAARPDVAQVTANHHYQLQEPVVQAPALGQPNGVEANIAFIKAPAAWAMGYTGQGMVVADNDTGLDETHPAIAAHYRGCVDPPICSSWDHNYNWWDSTGTYPIDPDDGRGHGTHTTGTMVGDDGAGNQIGVAPGAQAIHCKSMTNDGTGQDSYFLTCFEWELAPWDLNHANPRPDLAPDAVNNSWGYFDGGQDQFRTAINNLQAAGIAIEVSAGNEGPGCQSLRSPGDYSEVLTTGSIQHLSPWPGTITDFSSRGPSDLDPSPTYYFPDIMAPGQGIRSSLPGNTYGSWSGTSMAGPHSTALIALMWSACPALQGQVELTYQIIKDTAARLTGQGGSSCGGDYTSGPNNDWGYGTIDAEAAVNAVLMFCGAGIGYLDGYVRDENSNPVEGAWVSAGLGAGENGQVDAITDPNGYYTMTLVVGTYDATASKNGYTSQTVTGIVIQENQTTHQDFALQLLGQWTPTTLSGCPDWTRLDAEYYPATGMAYILGGRSGTSNDGTIYRVNPVAGTCAATGATMPVPISNYTIALLNNGTHDVLCTFGGRDNASGYTAAVQCYDPITNAATQVASLPAGYSGYFPGGVAVYNNRAYIFGAFRNTSMPYHLNRSDRFDPTTNTFTQIGNISLGRGYIMAATVDGYIYAFGGDVFDGTNLVAQTIAERLDPVAGTWSDAAVADMPTAGGEGRAFGFDSNSPFGIADKVILAPAYSQWPGDSAAVVAYDVAGNSYDDAFPDLIMGCRNHADVFVPICSDPPDDGLPAMWVIGGRCSGTNCGGDNPPYAGPEYFPLSCPTAPVASFISNSPVCFGQAMAFTDTSSASPTAWWWEFGDGGTSNVQNPTHLYGAAQDFVVTLLVTNSLSSDDVTGTVTVNPLPAASFGYAPTSGPLPLTVYFSNTSLYAQNPTWDFGDGGTGSGDYVNHTYVTTGTFPVVLSVGSAYGCEPATAGADVVVYPVAQCIPVDIGAVNQVPNSCVVDFSADLTGDAPYTYTWDFRAFGTFNTPTPQVDFGATGTYPATLGVTNCGGANTDTLDFDVTVNCAGPQMWYVYLPLVTRGG